MPVNYQRLPVRLASLGSSVAIFLLLSNLGIAQPMVTISGSYEATQEVSDNAFIEIVDLEAEGGYQNFFVESQNRAAKTFEISVPAGKYAVRLNYNGFQADNGEYIDGKAVYFAYTSVDASDGDISGVLIPEALPNGRIFSREPPVAALISVGEPDENGVASVSGTAGASVGVAAITVSNLQTGHYTFGTSNSDGSFSISMFAPEGSYISVHQDQSGLALTNHGPTQGAGTIIRVPVAGEETGNFTAGGKLGDNGWVAPFETATQGAPDTGQVWLSGNIGNRNWSAGQTGTLSGSVKIYSRNIATQTPVLNGNEVYLQRVFDAQGNQELPNPVQASQFLTPSGLPVNRRDAQDKIRIGYLELGSFSQTSDRSGESSWSLSYQVPADLPGGTYELVLANQTFFMVEGLVSETRYTDAFPHYLNKLYSTGGATLVYVNANPNPRLNWALALNDLSNGARGAVALEDRSRLAISPRVKTNSDDLVLPAMNSRTGEAISYRLEPFAPLVGNGHRGWLNPPAVPFSFPTGQLSVSILEPNGTVRNLGTSVIAQPYIQEVSDRGGDKFVDNNPRQFYGLTTLNPSYDVTFDQYGLHTVTLTGHLFDTFGTRYEAGGTYQIYIANHLDLEYGVFPSTPFEVGDSFAPSVIVQPGVPADVQVKISHYPFSDPARKQESVVRGTANRFGYFHPRDNQVVSFDSPGEYRVDYTISYVDETGQMWMGSRSWGSVVATPDSSIITRGRRGTDSFEGPVSERQQWFNVVGDPVIEGDHIHSPWASGDVVWMENDSTEFARTNSQTTAMVLAASLQDPGGRLADYYRQRFPQDGSYFLVSDSVEDRISMGEIPLFSSSADRSTPLLTPDAPGNHWAYFYGGAARPGVAVREGVFEDMSRNTYWRFDQQYNEQLGTGRAGDRANDFKFLFNGAVYRAPDDDFFYYGAHGSLWVLLPDDDATGGRVFPPFQGAAGGPSGGPLMTLKGEDIEMFFHPMGVRPGSILEVGDVAAFSGQIAPTLPSDASITVTSPGGQVFTVAGQANKVGYFNEPASSFTVTEPGIWTVDVSVTHQGQTSAGPVEAPFPTGGVLGADNGRYEFYVTSASAPVADIALPRKSLVQPGIETLLMPLSAADLSNTQLHHSVVMPGFLMEQGRRSSLTHSYDAAALSVDFPNLDILDKEQRYGVDTVTLSYLLSGTNSAGEIEYRARQVLLQGEELMALQPPEPTAAEVSFSIADASLNAGEQLDVTMEVSGSGAIDAYVALVLPDGSFLTISPPLTLSGLNQIIPYALSQSAESGLSYSIVDIPLPDGVAPGSYTFFGIAVKSGDSVLSEANWLSVAQLLFTVQ